MPAKPAVMTGARCTRRTVLAPDRSPALVMVDGALAMAVAMLPGFVARLPLLLVSRLAVGAGEAGMTGCGSAVAVAVSGPGPSRPGTLARRMARRRRSHTPPPPAAWVSVVAPINANLTQRRPGPVPVDFAVVRNRWEAGHIAITGIRMVGLGCVIAAGLALSRQRVAAVDQVGVAPDEIGAAEFGVGAVEGASCAAVAGVSEATARWSACRGR